LFLGIMTSISLRLCSRAPLINMASGMVLYCSIGAQAFSKEGFKGLEAVYLTGQVLQGLVVSAQLNLLNQTTKMH